MTRFIHDQFAKDYLEELLSPYGEVRSPRRVSGEMRQIDFEFMPQMPVNPALGLLSRLAASPAFFEPFRNAATPDEICDCLLKLLQVKSELRRDANRNSVNLQEEDIPKLWILTPTASTQVLSGFGSIQQENWPVGIYFTPVYLRTAMVVIHQLPKAPDTLWLRILGRGNVQKQAVDELESLPIDNPFRVNALTLLNRLKSDLQFAQNPEPEDQELIMRLSPLFDQQLEQARLEGQQQGVQQGVQQGLEQGQQLIIENLLQFRFGSLDSELAAIVKPLLALPPQEFTSLILQLSNLSREELLARFNPSDKN